MLTKTSIKKPYTVIVMIVVIAIIGGVAVAKMPLDLFPEMDLPYMIVATMVPGSSPSEVENGITKPIEQQMRQVNNVKEVTSISADNVSAIIMELHSGTDMTALRQDIDSKLDSIEGSLEGMHMKPVIMPIDPDMMPVMTLTLSKLNKPIEESSAELNNIADKIMSVAGVSSVSQSGQIENNVFIQIDPERIMSDPSLLLSNHLFEFFNDSRNVVPTNLDAFINSEEHSTIRTLLDIVGPMGPNTMAKILSEMFKKASLFPEDSAEFNEIKESVVGMADSMLTPELISMVLTANNFGMPAGTNIKDGFFINIGEKIKSFDELVTTPAFALDLKTMKVLVEYEDIEHTKIKVVDGKQAITMLPNKLSEEKIEKLLQGGFKKIKTIPELLSQDMFKSMKTLKATKGPGDLIAMDTILSNINKEMLPKELDMLGANFRENFANDIKALVSTVLYTKSGDSYTINEDIYKYFNKLFEQPISIAFGDIAYVYRMNTASESHTIINGGEGVMLSIYKTPDASVTSVTKGISNLIKDMQKEDDTLQCIVLSNQGDVTTFMISSIAQNLLLGALFAVIVLLIFLRDWKPTLTVGMSIIVSLVFAFATMYLFGVTLNLVSMGGLALSVGMLVDNSIVVIENIYRKRNEGVSGIKAAYEGTKQVSGAILSSTITTVIVFLPVIFVEGITKQIFRDLAITIAVSLFASLLVAITFVPMISSRMLSISNKGAKKESKIFVKMKKSYSKSLNFMLNKKWITIVVVTVLFIGSIVAAFFMDVEFMPDTTMEQVIVSVGVDKTKLDKKKYAYDEIVEDVVNDIYREFDAQDYVEDVGVELSSGMSVMGFTMGGGNINAYVTLNKKKKVADAQEELNALAKTIAEKYPQDTVLVGKDIPTNGVDVQSMVNSYLDASLLTVNVFGSDIDEMRKSAMELTEIFETRLNTNGNVVKVESPLNNQTMQYNLIVDKTKASRYNLTPAQIFLQFFAESVPPTANANIQFTHDTSSSKIFINTTKNHMDRWYRAADPSGELQRLYVVKGDDVSDESKLASARYERRYYDEEGNISEVVQYKLNKLESRFVSTFKTTYNKDGSIKDPKVEFTTGEVYTVNLSDMPLYYDTSKIDDVDMVSYMLKVPTQDELMDTMQQSMGGGGMPSMPAMGSEPTSSKREYIPIFMLLEEESFATENGKITYRKVTDNDDTFKSMIDNKNYYLDRQGYVRYNFNKTADVEALSTIDPKLDKNPKVPTGIAMVESFNIINHLEGRRVVQLTLSSETMSNKQLEREIKSIIKEFNDSIDKQNAHLSSANRPIRDIDVEFLGQNKMIADTFNSLILMVVLAVVFIYLVMVAQFQSLKSPFIIMFTIPLALTGSILTLLMAGMPISVFALVGIILLVGIVVNNGIVFVDYVNKLMQSGMPKREALLRAAQDRIRPILMTALTTICSMLVSVFDTSMGAAAIKPMAVTVVGGLSYATLLTLFFVPIMYDLLNRKETVTVIKFDDDKEEDIEAEMRLSKINDVKEVLQESNTLQMMDETYIANMPTETPMETYINETTGDDIITPKDGDVEVETDDATSDEVVTQDEGIEIVSDTDESSESEVLADTEESDDANTEEVVESTEEVNETLEVEETKDVDDGDNKDIDK